MTGNNGPLLSDNAPENAAPGNRLLNSHAERRMFASMQRIFTTLTVAAAIALASAAGAQAACSVEYKAKRDNPLELFYDVAVVSGPCDRGTVRAQLGPILAGKGMTLLKILSIREQ